MTLGQMSEVIFMVLMPLFLARLGEQSQRKLPNRSPVRHSE